MYAVAHTSLALAAKRTTPAASLAGLMVAAQASELLWVGLTYTGVEHSTVDDAGVLHLEYLPYSHSLLVGLGLGVAVWALLRYVLRRPAVAAVFGLVTASHVVLDVIQHEPDIRLVPWSASPTLGLNLTAHPLLDLAVETAFSVACWAYYRGTWKLLAAIVALNVLDLPLMLAGEGGASPMAHDAFALPTVILGTIVLAWAVVGRLGRAPRQTPATTATTPAPGRVEDAGAGAVPALP